MLLTKSKIYFHKFEAIVYSIQYMQTVYFYRVNIDEICFEVDVITSKIF